MKNLDIDLQIKQNLNIKVKLSPESELLLFSKAENLLATRRDRFALREAKRSKQRSKFTTFGETISKIAEIVATHADMPAAATMVVVLFLAFFAFPIRSRVPINVSYSDLPDLPKTNDFAARYDAQLLAERMAYEREVEDAHKRTSGGI